MPPVTYWTLCKGPGDTWSQSKFLKGRTGSRIGLWDHQCAIVHFPEWKVFAKWTGTQLLSTGVELLVIHPRTNTNLNATGFVGAGLFCSFSLFQYKTPQLFWSYVKNVPVCISVSHTLFSKLIIRTNIGLLSKWVYYSHGAKMVCVNSPTAKTTPSHHF